MGFVSSAAVATSWPNGGYFTDTVDTVTREMIVSVEVSAERTPSLFVPECSLIDLLIYEDTLETA